MNTVKAIQTTLSTIKHAQFQTRRFTDSRKSFICLSKSNGSDSQSSKPEGDPRKQELLARIAMLQASKIRLTDYLDEKSEFLIKFAEEANAEFDKLGEDAKKDLDEASARIMENIKTQMQAFEESAEMNRLEIEENENKLVEFEDQIERDRNEGLFFKNLTEKKPVDKAKSKEETEKIKDVTKEIAGSKTRRNVYLTLIGLVVTGIAESFSSSPDWRKVAILAAILVPLITQFFYEQTLLSEAEERKEGKNGKNK